jgi:hypothetical protein
MCRALVKHFFTTSLLCLLLSACARSLLFHFMFVYFRAHCRTRAREEDINLASRFAYWPGQLHGKHLFAFNKKGKCAFGPSTYDFNHVNFTIIFHVFEALLTKPDETFARSLANYANSAINQSFESSSPLIIKMEQPNALSFTSRRNLYGLGVGGAV